VCLLMGCGVDATRAMIAVGGNAWTGTPIAPGAVR
jgi:hypothetical protein